MKIYRIKIDDVLYVKAVLFSEDGLEVIPTWGINEAGWYDETKAQSYCDGLNENKQYKEAGIKFSLEEVIVGCEA